MVSLRSVVCGLAAIALLGAPVGVRAEPPAVFHAQGEMAGEVTASSVLLQSRLTRLPGPALDAENDLPGAAGEACFEWSLAEDFSAAQRTPWQKAVAERDFIVRASLSGLPAGTKIHYRLIFGPDRDQVQTGTTRSFRTLSAPTTAAAPLAFCMGSCMNYHSFMSGKANGGGPVTASHDDNQLGYPSFAAMLALRPDFFIGTGDIVYYDHPAQSAAKTLPELRKKWHEQFRFPRLINFFAATPAYWSKDDHDFRYNDADLAGAKQPDAMTGIEIFREQMPIHPAGDDTTPTYRTHRVHRDLQLWFTEGRDFRSPNKAPDGPEKSLWGREQRDWLQRTLKESDAAWKIVINPTPMVGPDRASKQDNHTNFGGYRHEAEGFFAWLKENSVGPVFTFCGDRHWQYHSIHPLGVEEFSCGALNDENAIGGVKAGTPGSTDPEGLIKQPYLYPKATGGFLHVRLAAKNSGPADLVITFYDDEGKSQYATTKRSSN